jgi:uncharacterized protein DUF3471
MVPSHHFAVAVAANAGWVDTEAVAKKAVDAFFPGLPHDTRDYATDPKSWDAYTGEYLDPIEYGRIVVTRQGERLYVTTTPVPPEGTSYAAAAGRSPLDQVSDDFFLFTDDQGRATSVRFAFDPQVMPCRPARPFEPACEVAHHHARWFVSDFGTGDRVP